ncbi:hypothetical protein IAU60_004971 [Kwoniella sp. DSM 27419]
MSKEGLPSLLPPSPPFATSNELPSRSESLEFRVYGLNAQVTADHLVNFFAANARVLGVFMHPSSEPHGVQWAQLWAASDDDRQKCLALKWSLAPSGITISAAPGTTLAPPPVTRDLLTPDFSTRGLVTGYRAPMTPPHSYRNARSDLPGLSYRHIDPQGPLPRNLYIMGLPLDLTQMQFKSLFTQFGMVEHSTLLSQLDSLGRRRGFILMSTHREALEAMQVMNGKWLDGIQVDVSWALVQRESKIFGALPNRVIHPPVVPHRREILGDCSVLVENLDPLYFPNVGTVRDVFSHFGPISRVTIISNSPLQAVIHFDHEVSAIAMLNANGRSIGGRPVITRSYLKDPNSGAAAPPKGYPLLPHQKPELAHRFEPFLDDLHRHFTSTDFFSVPKVPVTPPSLNVNSDPFVPLSAVSSWSKEVGGGRGDSQVSLSSKRHCDTSSPSDSLSNSHSDSTKASGKDSGAVKPVNEDGDKTDHVDVWPTPPDFKSRWTSAQAFRVGDTPCAI